jgi:predicted nucleic acid-binding protein
MKGFLIDTNILSIFAKADGLSVLCRLLGCEELPITPSVLDELLVPLEYGYDFPQKVLDIVEVVAVTKREIEMYEALRLQGRVSTADAEMIMVCKQRGWLYITMDKVALRVAKTSGVETADLQALLEAIKRRELLNPEQLRMLIDRMEQEDRTRLPYKDSILADEE